MPEVLSFILALLLQQPTPPVVYYWTSNNVMSVALTEDPRTAPIYYTLDGTVPTTSSRRYSQPLTVGNSATVSALGIDAEGNESTLVQAVISYQASNPLPSLPAGTYSGPQTLTFSTATNSAIVFYTENGSAPSASTTPFQGPITISQTTTIKAITSKTGFTSSDVVTLTYIID